MLDDIRSRVRVPGIAPGVPASAMPKASVAVTPGTDARVSCWLNDNTAKSFQISSGTTSTLNGMSLISAAMRVPVEDFVAV